MANRMSPTRKRRIALYSLLSILGLALLLPLGSYSIHWLGSEAVAQDVGSAVNPRSNYWRAVKEGVSGYSAVQGPEAGVLITPGGTEWQQMRDGPVAKYLPWAIVGMFVLIVLYHLIHGRNKLDANTLSGRKLKRWNGLDRLVHWVTALSFIALAITGLSMLIGKSLLIPLLGKAGFAMWAQASITIHNVVGPIFSVGILLMIVLWVWHNFPTSIDVKWFKQGGGLLSRNHPPAGRMNAGEKVWFWLVALLGIAVCLTGLVMVAPIYGLAIPEWASVIPLVEGSRVQMQQANLIHAAVSVIWTAIAIGHIYIGTAGTEGAFEGMKTGYVSEEWARQHHDHWYDEQIEKGKLIDTRNVEEQTPDMASSVQPASVRS
jgi:formate dehydrogenase subunit gamma